MAVIPGGYYIKPRTQTVKEILMAPPHVREIYDWLYKECNHSENGNFKRGETMRSYKDIQEGLCWFVGWRKMTYSKHDCETAMKWLKKHSMITTRKTTRGMFVTIVNYEFEQNPANYENHKERRKKTTRKPQTADTINNNDKNVNNDKNEKTVEAATSFPYLQDPNFKKYFDDYKAMIESIRKNSYSDFRQQRDLIALSKHTITDATRYLKEAVKNNKKLIVAPI